MPNWCSSDLTLSGPQSAIDDVLGFIGARDDPPRFDFNRIIPYPAKYAAMDADWKWSMSAEEQAAYAAKYDGATGNGYNEGGYEWCTDHWGTKWNVDEGVTLTGPCALTFDTAWSPPIPVIRALGERFPNVTFTLLYYEAGMGFKGAFVMCGGQEVTNMTSDYHGERGG